MKQVKQEQELAKGKRQINAFCIAVHQVFIPLGIPLQHWFFFLIGMSGNKDWNGSLSLEWYVILPTGKNLGLDCLTAWCSWRTDFSNFSFSRFLSFFSFSTLCDSPSVSQIFLVFHWECGVWVCVFIKKIDMKTSKRLVKNFKKKRLPTVVPCGFFKIKLYTCQILKGSFFLTCQHLVKSFCFYILY